MTLRSQTVALIVLLAVLGIVFVLVGDSGVSTTVFSAEPTATYTPTPTPSPTPVPEASADHWAEVAAGQLTYDDPAIPAQIQYQQQTLDEFITSSGYQAPADDVAYPLVNLLQQMSDDLEQQAQGVQITIEPGAITGPVIEIIDNTPVALLHVVVQPQMTPSGQDFPGLDLARGLIDRGNGAITVVTYALQSEPSPAAYADFQAWLAANMSDLSAPEATAQATPEGGATPVPETPVAETPVAGATAVPESETPAAEATPVAEGETAEATPELVPPEAEPVGEAPAGPWLEVAPGQFVHAENPNAMIATSSMPIDEFAQQIGTEPPADDDPAPLLTVLEFLRSDLETQLAANGIAVDENDVQGPQTEVYGGVPVATIHITVAAQTTASGQDIQGQELLLGLIDRGDGTLALFQFVYQGEPDAAITADFEAWLADNAPALAEPEPAPEATPEPTLEATPEATLEATPAGD